MTGDGNDRRYGGTGTDRLYGSSGPGRDSFRADTRDKKVSVEKIGDCRVRP